MGAQSHTSFFSSSSDNEASAARSLVQQSRPALIAVHCMLCLPPPLLLSSDSKLCISRQLWTCEVLTVHDHS